MAERDVSGRRASRAAWAFGLLVVLAACRDRQPSPLDKGDAATGSAPAPDAAARGLRKWDQLGVTLLAPAPWAPASDVPAIDSGGNRVAVLESNGIEGQGSAATGRVLILRLAPGVSWEQGVSNAGWKRLPRAPGERDSFEAKIPDPFPHSLKTRLFVNGEFLVLFSCQFSTNSERELCDKQLEHLHLHGEANDAGNALAGPGFLFAPPPGWTRESLPGDYTRFATDAQPGFRLAVAGSRLKQGETADAALERYRSLLSSKEKIEVASVKKDTYAGCPSLEMIRTATGDEIAVRMIVAHFPSPEGDAVVACQVQALPGLEEVCETLLRSAALLPHSQSP